MFSYKVVKHNRYIIVLMIFLKLYFRCKHENNICKPPFIMKVVGVDRDLTKTESHVIIINFT